MRRAAKDGGNLGGREAGREGDAGLAVRAARSFPLGPPLTDGPPTLGMPGHTPPTPRVLSRRPQWIQSPRRGV